MIIIFKFYLFMGGGGRKNWNIIENKKYILTIGTTHLYKVQILAITHINENIDLVSAFATA